MELRIETYDETGAAILEGTVDAPEPAADPLAALAGIRDATATISPESTPSEMATALVAINAAAAAAIPT